MAEQQQLGPTQISVKDIPRLPVEQVRQIREQVEGEVKMLSDSLASLRAALARIDASRAAVEAMAKQQEGASMLVPLTGSMYIAGTVAEPSHVLIDVGAGYYIEKSVEEAMGYCMRKAELLRANHDKFSEVARAKRQLLEEVTMVLQAKPCSSRAGEQQLLLEQQGQHRLAEYRQPRDLCAWLCLHCKPAGDASA
ncbi:unnamed protein product [Closterium sp. Naga37s-1]|nr:unnamed protein product [Closterium sp. Naga37s-1]